MGNTQQKFSQQKLVDTESVSGLSYLEDGEFAKIYKGQFAATPQGKKVQVVIKAPRVGEQIRKEKKLVKTHIEEVKRLWPNIRRAKGEFVVKCLGVSFDSFRQEVWIIREYVDGVDLETLLKNPSLCPALKSPERRLQLAIGITSGMCNLHHHRLPIVHGDFKTSDVLVNATTLTPKIANFGMWDFKNFFIRNTLPEGDFLNPCQAPEVMIGGERPTLFSDAWSLGAVVLQWMTRTPPWDMQDLCSRYRVRLNQRSSALRDAMINEEEPSVAREELGEELDFLRESFNYQDSDRISPRVMRERLEEASRTPTWTNIAFHKFYDDGSSSGQQQQQEQTTTQYIQQQHSNGF